MLQTSPKEGEWLGELQEIEREGQLDAFIGSIPSAKLQAEAAGGGTLASGVGALMASVLRAPVDSNGVAGDIEDIRRLIITIKEGKLM